MHRFAHPAPRDILFSRWTSFRSGANFRATHVPSSRQSRELCKNENVRGGPNFSAPFRIQQWSFLHNTRATRTFRPEIWRARMEMGDRPHMPRPLTRIPVYLDPPRNYEWLFGPFRSWSPFSISSPTRHIQSHQWWGKLISIVSHFIPFFSFTRRPGRNVEKLVTRWINLWYE